MMGQPGGRPAKPLGQGRAHAKTILFGEHSVVHGRPAVAIPIPELIVEAEVSGSVATWLDTPMFSGSPHDAPSELEVVTTALRAALGHLGGDHVLLRLRSNFPHGRGLGSSAAVAAAVSHAVADWRGRVLSHETRHEIIQEAERVAHGTPSGLDARAVVADGPIRFLAGAIAPLAVAHTVHLVLADTGRPGSTAEAVAEVRRRLAVAPAATEVALSRLGELADAAVAQLGEGNLQGLGDGMVEAHDLLAGLGVSTPELDGLITEALGAGAPGAKLTGSGLGGCVLVLAHGPKEADRLADVLLGAGAARTWTTRIGAT